MEVRQNTFPKSLQQWDKLHTEIAQSLSLEVFKTYLIQLSATWSGLTTESFLSRRLVWRPLEAPPNLNFHVILFYC